MSTLVRTLVLFATILFGTAAAQIDLTPFSSGDPIVAEEVNGNFQELADAVTAIADGEYRILPPDLTPTDDGADYRYGVNNKSELFLDGDLAGFTCFGHHVRLPDGATVTRHGSTMAEPSPGDAPDGDRAEAYFLKRPFSTTSDQAPDAVVESIAAATTFQESATIGGNLPETIDNETYVYEYRVCLEGGGRFLNARLTYTLP